MSKQKNLWEKRRKIIIRRSENKFNGSIDYSDGTSNEVPIPALDSLAYITVGIKSGLQKEDLTEDEINVMKEFAGEGWYEHILASINDVDDHQNNQHDTKA